MSISKQTSLNGQGFGVRNSAGSIASDSLDRTTSENIDMLVHAGENALGRIIKGPGKVFSLFLVVPALIAFGISCYLAYTALTASEIAGCGNGQLIDCSHVLHSKYAKWFGIPVSILAAANYFFVLAALTAICFSIKSKVANQFAWAVVAFGGIAAGLAALWFVGLQVFVLGKYCPWCLGAHSCGAVIAISILIKRPVGAKQLLAGIGMAAIAVSGLIIGQVTAEEPVKYKVIEHPVTPGIRTNAPGLFSAPGAEDEEGLFSPPEEEDSGFIFEAPRDANNEPSTSNKVSMSLMGLFRPMAYQGAMISFTPQEEATQEKAAQEEKPERRTIAIQGNLKLDPKQWPLLGSPDAKHVFVEMFDYACPHCRATHEAIKGACDSLGEDLAVIVLPVPLNSACNSTITVTGANFVESCDLAKLAVACWRLDAEKFQEFHHWMFEGATVPSYANAKAKAAELVGLDKLDAELGKDAPAQYISKHVQLYQHAGNGVVPKLMFPTTTIEGEYTSTTSLVELIKQRAK